MKACKLKNNIDIRERGVSLVEVIVVSAILTVVVSAFIVAINAYITLSYRNSDDVKVGYLLEEGIEAVKILRDTSWTSSIATLPASSTRYFLFEGGTWKSTTTRTLIDGKYERSFSLYNVNRDGNDDIVSSGGSNDAGTKKVTVRVSYMSRGATTTKELSSYVTNLFDN